MIAYLIKSGLCLTLLIVTYHLLLEREKMHQFNRVYLLFALIFGLTIPLLQIEISSFDEVKNTSIEAITTPAFVGEIPVLNDRPILSEPNSVGQETSSRPSSEAIAKTAETSSLKIKDLLIAFYMIGVLIFVIRFLMNLFQVLLNRMNNETRSYGRTTLVLMDNEIMPHSFLGWIFLPKKAYLDHLIEDQVLTHELVHIRGKHSWDVLFVEFLKVIFWFNPVFYFYKKAIQLNHEYIADQEIVDSSKSLLSYQNLLLKYAGIQINTFLTSNLSFRYTKRRLLMMNKQKNSLRNFIKKALLTPIVVFSLLFFSDSTKANLNHTVNIGNEITSIDSTYSGSPYYSQFANRLNTYQEVYKEFEASQKTKRDVLYQRIRLVWLHQRLTPEEQSMFEVPDLPKNFSEDVPLTEIENTYQEKFDTYVAFRESLDKLPDSFDHELYDRYDELRSLYEELDFYAQVFIVNNLPNVYRKHVLLADREKEVKDRSLPPIQVILSKHKEDLALHYLDENGNTVSTTVGALNEKEIEYLMNNTKKSLITQVYPLPVELKPTDQELEKWQDDYYYQIWLDGKVIENEALKEMDMDSLHHFRIHEIRWNANRRVPYDYQVLMYTHEAFDDMVRKYRPSKGMIPFHEAILLK